VSALRVLWFSIIALPLGVEITLLRWLTRADELRGQCQTDNDKRLPAIGHRWSIPRRWDD
jgi:hypothetical protein